MRIPKEITAGNSATWDDDPSVDNLGNEIDSSEYTLTYHIRGLAVTSLDLVAVANGTGWRTSITTTESNIAAGTYYWEAKATKSGAAITLGRGQIKVLANISAVATANYDGRSQARIDLDNVQAAIRSLSSNATKAYTIGNRSFTKIDMADLLKLEAKLKADVAREEKAEAIANGLGNPDALYVRFKK